MSDFESRLTDALSSGAERAPDASGLADGARRRSRRRRRAVVAVAAAAVVAAVAVPVGVVALRDGGSDGGDAANDPSASPSVPSDTRIETWHDLQVEVPAFWGYGGRTAWCTGGEAETPVVERPGGVVAMIACSPAYSYGVSFRPSAPFDLAYENGHVWQYGSAGEYAQGSWVGYWYDNAGFVEVNAADKETVQQIIDSVQRVGSVDGNGCPVVDDGDAGAVAVADDGVSVCRYSAEGDLEQSERLVGDDAEAAGAAIESAPERDGSRGCANGPTSYVVMTVDAKRAEVQYEGNPACGDRGVFLDGTARLLTEDVLYWALSPGWSGSVEQGVPLPDKLRQLPVAEPTEPPAEESPCPEGKFMNSDFALDPDNGEHMTVCRMERDWDGESGGSYLLADTTVLSEEESAAVRAAVEAAPVLEESDFVPCSAGPGEFFLVLAGDKVPLWVYNGECGELTALTLRKDGPLRQVTPELLDALGSPYGLLR